MNRRVIFALFLLLPLVVALTGGCACVGGRYHHGMGKACMMSCSKECGGAGQACCKMHSGACMQKSDCCKGQKPMCGSATGGSSQCASATQMSCGSVAGRGAMASCGTMAACGSKGACGSKATCSPAGCNKPNCCKKQGSWGKAQSGCPLPADQCWGYCRHSVSKSGGSGQGCSPAGCATPCAPQKAQAGAPGCAPGCGAKK